MEKIDTPCPSCGGPVDRTGGRRCSIFCDKPACQKARRVHQLELRRLSAQRYRASKKQVVIWEITCLNCGEIFTYPARRGGKPQYCNDPDCQSVRLMKYVPVKKPKLTKNGRLCQRCGRPLWGGWRCMCPGCNYVVTHEYNLDLSMEIA